MQIDRPKECLETHHPKGTTVTLQLTYSEMITLEHALFEYQEQGKLDDNDKFFYWQFHALRDILKQGSPTSWIPQLFEEMFNGEQDKEVKE